MIDCYLSDEIVKNYNELHDLMLKISMQKCKRYILTGECAEVINEYPKLKNIRKLLQFEDIHIKFDDSKISDEIVSRMFRSSYKGWIQNLSYKLCKIIIAATENTFDDELVIDWNEYYPDIKTACENYIDFIDKTINVKPVHYNIQ